MCEQDSGHLSLPVFRSESEPQGPPAPALHCPKGERDHVRHTEDSLPRAHLPWPPAQVRDRSCWTGNKLQPLVAQPSPKRGTAGRTRYRSHSLHVSLALFLSFLPLFLSPYKCQLRDQSESAAQAWDVGKRPLQGKLQSEVESSLPFHFGKEKQGAPKRRLRVETSPVWNGCFLHGRVELRQVAVLTWLVCGNHPKKTCVEGRGWRPVPTAAI